ncbi:MAG: response regulator [Elusimicrobia bacterium]|nr:response regulator [Elusimicrobiota bacterium]
MSLLDPKTKTVLIVDDDESMLNLLEIMIRRDGFKIDLAATGEKALEKLKSSPDALVLDLMLPGITGFEVISHLSRTPAPPPVIVVTAYAHTKEVQDMRKQVHVEEFLVKPISQKKLLSILHRVLKTQPPQK